MRKLIAGLGLIAVLAWAPTSGAFDDWISGADAGPQATLETNLDATETLELGAGFRLEAFRRTPSGNLHLAGNASFASSDPSVVSVTPGGDVEGVGWGVATVTATAGSASTSVSVTVTVPPASLDTIVFRHQDTIEVGDTICIEGFGVIRASADTIPEDFVTGGFDWNISGDALTLVSPDC